MKLFNGSKFNKRIVSIATAVAVLAAGMPLTDISDGARQLFTGLTTMAADVAEYPVDTANNRCFITSYTELVSYSQAYQAYPDKYQTVDVHITISNTNDEDVLDSFESIGTSAYPFAADMRITLTHPLDVSLNVPLFNYIYDSTKIIDTDSDAVSPVTIERKTGGTNAPLFAKNVVHDPDLNVTEYASWSVTAGCASALILQPYDFAGMIGTVGENAVVDLTVTNDAAKDGSYGNISSAGDVGLACGTMLAGSHLTVTFNGASTNNRYGISSTGGSAGGLVGRMYENSTLTVNGTVSTDGEITANQYAGGLVGRAKDSVIDFTADTERAAVGSIVSGSVGTGGIFGIYQNTGDFTVSDYKSACKLGGSNAGGIFGLLENSGTVTIDGTNEVSVSKPSGASSNYGGLIGVYSSGSSANTLNITGVTVSVSSSVQPSNFGGFIGNINDDSYVNFSGVTANVSGSADNIKNFGGLVGYMNNGFIDADDVTVSVENYFYGGGLVGTLNGGILRLGGTTDLSSAQSSEDKNTNYGQIVGKHNQALIYAKSGWKLIRSSTEVAVDDVGTWGEVVRFNDSDFTEASVVTVDGGTHTVTVKPAVTTMSSASDFAATALNIQLNMGDAVGALRFDPSSLTSTQLLSSTLTLSDNIDLTGKGFTGFTRDNGTNDQFTGTLDGGGHTLTLATGEPYGYRGNDSTPVTSDGNGFGIIYLHTYSGLFAKTGDGATFKNTVLDGAMYTCVVGERTRVGGFSSYHEEGSITFDGVTAKETLYANDLSRGNYTNTGALIGQVYTADDIKVINNCVITPTITSKIASSNSDTMNIGGAIGCIDEDSAFSVLFENVTMGAKIDIGKQNNGKLGGLIAFIANYSDFTNRKVTIKNVTFDNAKITANSSTRCGGLLGDIWHNTQVFIGENNNGVGENGISFNNCSITQSGAGASAGLVCHASGYWQVNDIDINGLTVSSNANSFGMLVNQGWILNNQKALYLELTNKTAYTIDNGGVDLSGLKSSTVFDEFIAYANFNKSNICNNGHAVISIHTEDPDGNAAVIMDGANCNTYQNQTSRQNTNPNARYYYNLDVIRNKTAGQLSPGEKLLMWSVNNYAYSNIKSFFTNGFTNTISGELDLSGLSYYPVDVSSSVTVSAGTTVKFYNNEIETSESGNGNTDGMIRSTVTAGNSYTQHYLMHCGLFRNISGSAAVNGITISGNVGKTSEGSGALVYGTVSGSSTSTASLTCSSVVLDGVTINGSVTSSDYTPLLINKVNSYASLTINGVSTTDAYANAGIVTVATSLIGKAGESTASNIKLRFGDIRLDGRTASLGSSANGALDSAYNTQQSIFSKAILLDSFSYADGSQCSGIYNFKYSEDWNSDDTAVHHVAYGKEISETQEYVGLQDRYVGSDYYTSPETPKCETAYSFASGFLPYVAAGFSEANKTHEIMVNHTNKANLDNGCGTYNDPYIITDGEQLTFIASILSGDTPTTDGTVVDFLTEDNYRTWCTDKTAHTVYAWNSDKFYLKNVETDEIDINTSVELETVRKSLSTAYYKLGKNITLPKTFTGLGNTDSYDYCFRGVIDGSGFTVTNLSSYPLIINSTGSVVKDLDIVSDAAISLSQSSNAGYTLGGGCAAYGAVIGQVFGGDNIIDNVNVSFTAGKKITTSGNNAHLIAIGGYVGVVRYGAVIFRNMGADSTGLTSDICAGVGDSSTSKLYQNPVIGRVVDGFALTESDSYQYDEASVTMHNGTKNYSIADIDRSSADIISFSDINMILDNRGWEIGTSTITVPDSQLLFLLGCITMSGAGKVDLTNNKYYTGYNLMGYGNGQMVRSALYSEVGTDAASSADFIDNAAKFDKYAFEGSYDSGKFNTNKDPNADTVKEVVPYIIYKYTDKTVNFTGKESGVCNYPARTLTSNGSAFTIDLAGGNYYLPAGFRGIGSINDINDYSQMYIYGIRGNGSTITMNTEYNMYQKNSDNYDTNNSGIGLFNILNQNKNDFLNKAGYDLTDNGHKISDLTLSGKVHLRRFNTNGSENIYNNGNISAGGLGGIYNSTKCTMQLENVAMNSLDVFSTYHAGGIIGTFLCSAQSNANIVRLSADDLTVKAGRQAGGIAAYSSKVTYDINGYNGSAKSRFGINTIQIHSTNNDYFDAGGLFACFENASALSLKGMDIGRSDDVNGCILSNNSAPGNDNAEYLGGVLGFNKSNGNIEIDGLSITDLRVEGGSNCGSIIGRIINNSAKLTVKNTEIIGKTSNALIYSESGSKYYGNSAGVAGFIQGSVTVDNVKVENYTMTSKRTEGCGGFFGKTEAAVKVSNCVVRDCTLKVLNESEEEVGGIIANLNNSNGLSGYNIVLDNVQMTDLDGNAMTSSSYTGSIVGRNNNQTYAIKLAGVSVRKTENGIYASKAVGNNFNTNTGYIIYCDYDGIYDNTVPSAENSGSNVTGTDNTAFATINPKTPIDSDKFLTGDGTSDTALTNIMDGIDSSANKAYKDVSADRTTFEKYLGKISTFNTETGAAIADDFNVLVINDSNYKNVTEMLNSYIHLLTGNSTVTYSQYVKTSDRHDGSKIYNISITPYRLNDSTGCFEVPESYTPALIRENNCFRMSDDESSYDSNYKQFTLLDVQFRNPIENSASGKIAYHLYIPVMVEKILKFDFAAGVLSGTNYKVSDYTDGSAVMESYGTPVTAHMTYTYNRTAQEWTDAIYGKENILNNYGKSVILSSASALPADTQLVLVDRNNYGKAYYSTIGEAFSAENNKLTFTSFKTADGTQQFVPVSFYELLSRSADITAAESDTDGTFIECNENEATVKTTDTGRFYRKKTDTDPDTAVLYTITVSNKDPSADPNDILDVYEDYYISFFTKASTSEVMRNITISCDIRLDDTGMTPSHIAKNTKATIILGNLYTQTFSFLTKSNEEISETNNSIEAELQTTIAIQSEYKGTIMGYMNDPSIHIYHGFVIEVTTTNENGTEKGVKGNPNVSGTYKIGSNEYSFNKTNSGSVIQLWAADAEGAMQDIKEQLINGSDVIISCSDLQIQYVESAHIAEQFPMRPAEHQEYGVTLSANSNLAYVPENILYSSITKSQEDSNGKVYYRQGEITVASLNYNVPLGADNTAELSHLGINGREVPDVIDAVGYYDVSNISDEEMDNAVKVRFELTLSQKQEDGSYAAVDINEYLKDIKLYDKDGTAVTNSSCIYEFNKDQLVFDNSIFEINTSYSVITGAELEGKSYLYSNYKVLLTAQLLDKNGSVIANSGCSDHIIYTNAKICTELFTTG